MVTVRGLWDGEQAWRPRRKIRVPFQPIVMKSPSVHDPGALKNAAVCRRTGLKP